MPATAAARPLWLRPKWVVGHVLIAALVLLAVRLGFWQLDRLEERRAVNADIAARTELAPAPVADLVAGAPAGDSPAEVGDALQYRAATATGTYDAEGEVLIRSRSLDERPGYWVVTPLLLDDGTAVAVNRGFVPFSDDLDAALATGPPPEGAVSVEGIVVATQERDGIGPTDPAEGRLQALARLDVVRLDQQHPADLLPVALQLTGQEPEQAGPLPVALPTPEQDEGSHLAYAGQWFLFAVIGAVGWPVLVRHTVREEAGGAPGGPPRPRRDLPPVDDAPLPPHRGNGSRPPEAAGAPHGG
jgi:surfeit locus 1 family protein